MGTQRCILRDETQGLRNKHNPLSKAICVYGCSDNGSRHGTIQFWLANPARNRRSHTFELKHYLVFASSLPRLSKTEDASLSQTFSSHEIDNYIDVRSHT